MIPNIHLPVLIPDANSEAVHSNLRLHEIIIGVGVATAAKKGSTRPNPEFKRSRMGGPKPILIGRGENRDSGV